jgi:hypothetical protein
MQQNTMETDSVPTEVHKIDDDMDDRKVILIHRACKTNDKDILSTMLANDPKSLVLFEKGLHSSQRQ